MTCLSTKRRCFVYLTVRSVPDFLILLWLTADDFTLANTRLFYSLRRDVSDRKALMLSFEGSSKTSFPSLSTKLYHVSLSLL